MKYYIADPYSEGGLHQLGGDRVEELPDGKLRYRPIGSSSQNIALRSSWTTEWESSVMLAYQHMVEEIERLDSQIKKIKTAKTALVKSSPELQRLENQLSLF